MTKLSVDQVTARIHDLPSLPAIVVELLESVNQQDVNIDALAAKISYDQALAAKTLRLANSSFYGLQRKVTSFRDAIAVLGLRSVRTLVTAAAVTGNFTATTAGVFDFKAFWRHSIAAALAARALARLVGASEDSAFTAGLLHDVGRLVIVTRFPQHYQATFAHRAAHDGYLLDAEVAVLGIDHTMAGRALAQHWKFPPVIQEAIADHHLLKDTEAVSLAGIVHIADAISHALDLSGEEDDLVPPISTAAWSRLGLASETSARVFRDMESQFEGICQVLVA
jgi:putative nucleotidyltransferase with HDIG domain